MPFELARAHRRFLRLVGPRRPRSDDEAQPPREVDVTPAARAFFRQVLDVGGQYQGGALFGHLNGGVLTVEYAAPNGYACWQREQQSPLDLDARYLLGLTDAYRSSRETPIDWVGNWLSFPDGGLPSYRESLNWLDEAVAVRLVDSEHCLLMVGWAESRLGALACVVGEVPQQMVVLPHNLASAPPIIEP